jgi:adenosylmethionine-8-amino-7-oxononanoate aminotransferase
MIMAPPLVSSLAELDALVEMLAQALDMTAGHFEV